MKLVIIESPFGGAGDATVVAANVMYARECAKFGLTRWNESGWGSHMIWPQFLDDTSPAERELGIQAGLAWSRVADYHVFYTDRGWSRGMLSALEYCIAYHRSFRLRSLEGRARIRLPPAEAKALDHLAHALVKTVVELYP